MHYQVLARKWRPKTFSEVVGQEHVLTALSNGLKHHRLHHAYLFSGTRGVGKTSIARLFAKGLNCAEGVTAEPCGHCENCLAIEEGHFIDLIEIDAASRTKVEDTRELLDNVQYKPAHGRYKVYLIDEVHMLSRHSFNALLKTLEEPPEYVKFLLATTDPQKLPVTILSRCMQFHLKALDKDQINRYLQWVLQQEEIPFESLAIELVAKAAKGSIRDSLSLMEQAIALSDRHIRLDIVQSMLGVLEEQCAIKLIQAISEGQGDTLMQQVAHLASKGVAWEQVLVEVAEVLHQLAMLQLLSNEQALNLNIDRGDQARLLAKSIPAQDIQLYYQIMLNGRKELAYAPDQRIGVEMTLLRALAFSPVSASFNELHHSHETFSSQQPQISATLSQTRQDKANLISQNKIIQPQIGDTISSVESVSSSIEQTVDSLPVIEQNQNTSESLSHVLAALKMRDQLRDSQTSPSSKEKKNRIASPIETILKPTALPVKDYGRQNQVDSMVQRLVNASKSKNKENDKHTQEESTTSDEDRGLPTAKTYQWTWRDPTLGQDEEPSQTPSDIRKAMLQEQTPELRQKILELSLQENPLEALISHIPVSLARQIPLNSVLLENTKEQIKLGLRSSQAHLDTEKNRLKLTELFNQQSEIKKIVTVEINDDPSLFTPVEQRQQIYHKLTEQAQQALLEDEKLQTLLERFSGNIDPNSIRPI